MQEADAGFKGKAGDRQQGIGIEDSLLRTASEGDGVLGLGTQQGAWTFRGSC